MASKSKMEEEKNFVINKSNIARHILYKKVIYIFSPFYSALAMNLDVLMGLAFQFLKGPD